MSAQPDFSSAARADEASDTKGRGWVAAGVAALLLAGLAARYQQSELDAARAELLQARVAAKGEARGAKRGDATHAQRRAESQAAQARASAAGPPARVLFELQALAPPGVRFERIVLTYGQDLTVDLDVVARSAADYDRLLSGFERAQAFADVTPGPENREGQVRSSLSLRYVGARP